jgi:outer membrane protein OmpA-like peptidoglycan-associated protein
MRHNTHFKKAAMIRLTLIVGVFVIASSLRAQDERPFRFGVGGGYGSNISSAYIEAYQGSFLCGVFQNGSAPGLSFFIQAEQPITHSISFFPRIGYEDRSSTFTTQNFTIPNAYDVQTSSLVPVYRQRQYAATVKSLSLDLLAGVRPFGSFILRGGLAAAFVIRHSYDQTEKLLSNFVYKENNLSTREVSSGSFDAKTFLPSAEFSVGYDFSLPQNITLSPELCADLPFSPITSNGTNYKTETFSVVISLMKAFPAAHEAKEIIPPPPPPPVEIVKPAPVAEVKKEEPIKPKNILKLSVKAVGMTETGEEIPAPVVSIENVRVTDVAPTLNYVFFDDGASDIPKRYHSYSDAKAFSPSSLYTLNTLGIHYEVLNILGMRMQQKPGSKITITGTRSLHSAGDSTAASDISLLRAQHTAKYLQDVWGIAPSRIKIRSRGLPEQPSDESKPTGQAENRRIEITTNTPSLLEPFETHRIERTATPPNIDFHADITSSSGIKSQVVTIRQGGKIIKTLDWLSHNPGDEMLWNITEGNVIGTQDSVTWQMDVVDSLDNAQSVSGTIRITKDVQNITRHATDTSADKSLERFHLLLFDYSSSAELNSISDEIFDRIASSITPDSRVSLIGHTDITGDPQYNEHLSYDRASRASLLLSSRLRRLGHSSPEFNLEARGAKDILFDNSNAEGRFLSRTVRITIERDLHK